VGRFSVTKVKRIENKVLKGVGRFSVTKVKRIENKVSKKSFSNFGKAGLRYASAQIPKFSNFQISIFSN